MTKMFLIFSHTLTPEQEFDAKHRLKIDKFIILPEELQKTWSNIPPDIELSNEFFEPFTKFLIENKGNMNYALIQGDFGATFFLVDWCFKNGFIPVYATTQRLSKEDIDSDGKVIISKVFKHVRFRKYLKAL